jgi:hypothetical protein
LQGFSSVSEVFVARRRTSLVVFLALAGLAALAASPGSGGAATAGSCGSRSFAYAGLQADGRAHGVSATLVPVESPDVTVGHVAGWVGVGGTDAGPGGVAEWLQTGFVAFDGDQTSRMYYEVTVPGSAPRMVELDSNVGPSEKHRFAVLEMAKRHSWWRVWIDHKPVTAPIHLPGSHGKWVPEAVAENWNGNQGACNAYDYRFANVRVARRSGGVWRALRAGYVFEDAGYEVVQTSRRPRTFVAASVVKPESVRAEAAAQQSAAAPAGASTSP